MQNYREHNMMINIIGEQRPSTEQPSAIYNDANYQLKR